MDAGTTLCWHTCTRPKLKLQFYSKDKLELSLLWTVWICDNISRGFVSRLTIKWSGVYISDSARRPFVPRLKTVIFCVTALSQLITSKRVFLDSLFLSLKTHAEGILPPSLQFWHPKSYRDQRRLFMHFVMEKVKVSDWRTQFLIHAELISFMCHCKKLCKGRSRLDIRKICLVIKG